MQFERLGPYQLGKKLGQGGMGAVYQGIDESTGHPAAIKVLSPQLAGDEGFRVRFAAEIESLKKLRHPNIVRLFGYGEEQGLLFYAMELVDGTSLEDELRAGRRFEWREVTQLTIKLCRALKHAHDHGVIHRDIKPANLLLSHSGEVKLSDFGIARLFGNTRLTSDGGVLGTAEYMAPEQADGRAVTDRCDQYSLGGVMYALLAGHPPFRGTTMLEVLQLQRYAEPEPVRRHAPDTPSELDRIILQLLEKDPQKRFANTLILARSLEAMERGLSLSAGRDDFVVPDHPAISTGRGIDSLAATIVPVGDSDGARIELEVPQAPTAPGSVNVEPHPPPPQPPPGSSATPADAIGRFTKVEEESTSSARWHQEIGTVLTSWQTLVAAGGLLAIALLAWYGLKPPSADQLFAKIEQGVDASEPGELFAVEPSMRRFLQLYPDDSRSQRVQSYVQDVNDLRRQRRLEKNTRRMQRTTVHSPVERAYLAALAAKATSPELAIAKFRALADLYGRSDAQEKNEWVRLAREEIKLLEKQVAENQREDRAAILGQLAAADQIRDSDPATAQKIWQAVITLYGDKPWAAGLVERARQSLEATASRAGQPPADADGSADRSDG